MYTNDTSVIEPLQRISRDLAKASASLGMDEARFLVQTYYREQEDRIRAKAQIRAADEAGEPRDVLDWYFKQKEMLEHTMKTQLGRWAEGSPAGRWLLSVIGIGPVLAAGYLSNIPIERTPTVGDLYSFAGLSPKVKWLGTAGARTTMTAVDEAMEQEPESDAYAMTPAELELYERIVNDNVLRVELSTEQLMAISRLTNRKFGNLLRLARDPKGRVTRESMTKALAKRPWNADLKRLTWLTGESFVKVSNNPNDVYGKLYVERKMLEQERNERRDFADQAATVLATKRIGKETDAYAAYSDGKLPPAHIHARAKRYAVKIFLSHMFTVMFEYHYGKPAPTPYPIEHLGHVHMIPVPNYTPLT